MAYHIVGLDRGTCIVKAVILERSFRGNEVQGTRAVKVPQNGSGPPSREAIRAAVSQLVDEFDPGTVGYITDMPSGRASTWFLSLPFSDQRRITQTLPFELENYTPFDLDDMVMDYRVVRTDQGKSRILASMVPKEEVEETLQFLKRFRVDPRGLVLDAYALSYMPPGKDDADRTIAVVDIGHTQTVMMVRSGTQPDFIHTVPRGGLAVTQALMRRFAINYPTAEAMKVALAPVRTIQEENIDPGLLPPPPSELDKTQGADENLHALETTNTQPTPAGLEQTVEQGPVPGESTDQETDATVATVEEDASALHHLPEILDGDEDDTTVVFQQRLGQVLGDDTETHAGAPAGAPEPRATGLGRVADVQADPAHVPQQARDEIERVVWEAMEPTLHAIRNALMAYEGSERREIDAVLLVGGGSLLRGLPEHLEEDLGTTVGCPVKLGPDQMVLGSKEELPRYAKAFGLAYLGATDAKCGEINFRRGEFSYQKSYKVLRRYLFAAIALFFVGLSFALSVFVSDVRDLGQTSETLDEQVAAAIQTGFPDLDVDISRGLDMPMSLMAAEHAALEARARSLGLEDNRRMVLEVLREISEVIPRADEIKVDVEDLSFEGNQLKLRGTADKFESIDKMEKAIGDSPIVAETKKEYGSKGAKKNFNMVITLHEPGDDSSS